MYTCAPPLSGATHIHIKSHAWLSEQGYNIVHTHMNAKSAHLMLLFLTINHTQISHWYCCFLFIFSWKLAKRNWISFPFKKCTSTSHFLNVFCFNFFLFLYSRKRAIAFWIWRDRNQTVCYSLWVPSWASRFITEWFWTCIFRVCCIRKC